MNILKNVNLGQYSSMGLGGNAKYLVEITNVEDIKDALDFAKDNTLNTLMIGGGNNLIFSDKGFDGLVLINDIKGIEQIDEATFKIGAGEDWDEFVDFSVEKDLSGIECLSKIPGKMGSAPIQNIGAYGQEIKDTLISVEVYDLDNNEIKTLNNSECDFSYRNSIFKKNPGKYFVISITLKLHKEHMKPPFYESVNKYLTDNNINEYTPRNLRNAVSAIRLVKLPDPKLIKNCGSFFTNPIIEKELMDKLVSKYPEIPHWEEKDDRYKVSAAWLLESTGFKNYHDKNGMATWKNQPLVVVNENAKSINDLLEFKDLIVDKVKEKFDITLEMEPVLI